MIETTDRTSFLWRNRNGYHNTERKDTWQDTMLDITRRKQTHTTQ